jgi:signal transduction histidine kinase
MFVNDLDVKKQAEYLGVSLWRTPSMLFILMGAIIVIVMLLVYYLFKNYNSPEALIASEVIVVIVLMSIGNFIIRNVEEMAKINKLKSEFISITSHQLKTPLSEINWELELLLSRNREGLSQKQLEIINNVADSSNKMTRLVSDLLDVTRIDQGRFFLEIEDVNIVNVIKEVVKNNQFLAKNKKVEIKLDFPENLSEVSTDKKKLMIVVDNLLSNAIKYIKEGGQVEIKAKEEGGNVVVSVRDNGMGIPIYQQEKIFQKFFRSDNTGRYQTTGTGLGLYISKNIVEQSGGKIWFESEENEGSTFYFSLSRAVV